MVVVLLHGGGSSALDFLGLSQEFPPGDDLCWLAPQAMSGRWFPYPVGRARRDQEPHLTVSSKSVLGLLQNHSGQRLALAGFADGAGVVAELLTDPDLPRSVVGAWLASGGLVGEEEEWPERPRLGSNFQILVSGGRDIPDNEGERLAASGRFFEAAGARVRRYLYEGASPGIVAEELRLAQEWLREVRK